MPSRTTEVFKGTGTEVAKIVSASGALQEAAERVKATAVQIAQSNRLTGAYISAMAVETIPGKRGVRDAAVVNTDPAAHIIESGYLKPTKSGTKRVAGQFILTRAAAETPEAL